MNAKQRTFAAPRERYESALHGRVARRREHAYFDLAELHGGEAARVVQVLQVHVKRMHREFECRVEKEPQYREPNNKKQKKQPRTTETKTTETYHAKYSGHCNIVHRDEYR